MTRAKAETKLPPPMQAEQTWTAELARVAADGRVFARTPGGGEQPVLILNGAALRDALVPGARVLLVHNTTDPAVPILVGVLEERLPAGSRERGTTCEVNGRRIHLNGEEEIRLTCGRSTIVLTRDGQVIVRGARIVSRAAQTNRVKGGSVQIN